MSNIKSYKYNQDTYKELKDFHLGQNWPVVYLMENTNEIYVGESTNVAARAKQHFDNQERKRMKEMHIITDEEYNISAAKDIESLLIEYISGDGKRKLQNRNGGMQKHEYYEKEKYQAKFELIWEELRTRHFVSQTLDEIRNKDVFKFSPYKSLTEDQMSVVLGLREQIMRKDSSTTIVNGGPGTGKTVLAIYLFKYLREHEETQNLKIGLVIPMTALRQTIGNVFRNISGLKKTDVLGPNQVAEGEYDLLIIDEAHRLKKRKNLTGYGSFDKTNKLLGFDKHKGTELDWIIKSSKHQIFFYDEQQSVRSTDVDHKRFEELKAFNFELETQHRVKLGEDYVEMVRDFWERNENNFDVPEGYDFKIFDDISEFRKSITEKNDKVGLSRIVSGYSWRWISKGKENPYQHPDIVIDGQEFIWNTVLKDWVNSENSINEVGCIHTIQGYDLNYVGVIIGKEIDYDPVKKEFVIDLDNYFDMKGKAKTDPEEVKRHLLNIYKTLMTRGILGTYIYVMNDELRKHLKNEFMK